VSCNVATIAASCSPTISSLLGSRSISTKRRDQLGGHHRCVARPAARDLVIGKQRDDGFEIIAPGGPECQRAGGGRHRGRGSIAGPAPNGPPS